MCKCPWDNDPQNLILPTLPSLLQVSSCSVRPLIYREHPVVFWTLCRSRIFSFLLYSDIGSIRGQLSALKTHSNVPVLSQESLPICLSLSIFCLYDICPELGPTMDISCSSIDIFTFFVDVCIVGRGQYTDRCMVISVCDFDFFLYLWGLLSHGHLFHISIFLIQHMIKFRQTPVIERQQVSDYTAIHIS